MWLWFAHRSLRGVPWRVRPSARAGAATRTHGAAPSAAPARRSCALHTRRPTAPHGQLRSPGKNLLAQVAQADMKISSAEDLKRGWNGMRTGEAPDGEVSAARYPAGRVDGLGLRLLLHLTHAQLPLRVPPDRKQLILRNAKEFVSAQIRKQSNHRAPFKRRHFSPFSCLEKAGAEGVGFWCRTALVRTMVCLEPHSTCTISFPHSFGTRLGLPWCSISPTPSWPRLFRPKAMTVPWLVTTIVWPPPQARMEITSSLPPSSSENAQPLLRTQPQVSQYPTSSRDKNQGARRLWEKGGAEAVWRLTDRLRRARSDPLGRRGRAGRSSFGRR